MSYYSAEDIQTAKQLDLLSYLRQYEPQELVHVSGNTWCTREHDSLKISNGKWNWFSRGIGGRSALDYLVKVKNYPFTDAVGIILGRAAEMPPVSHSEPQEEKVLLLPNPVYGYPLRVVQYLTGRGIDRKLIDFCIERKLLYESRDYHNAVFVGYDTAGVAKYAALRGTIGAYKGEATGSDKHYSFSLCLSPDAEQVHVFESAIDLLSYVTLEIKAGRSWKQDALLSLAGVFKQNGKQMNNYFPSKFISLGGAELLFKVGSNEANTCVLTTSSTYGSVSVSDSDIADHPELLCQSGSMSWNLHYDKEITFPDYRNSQISWAVPGAKTTVEGKIVFDGEEFAVTPKKSNGYFEVYWGKTHLDQYYHMSGSRMFSLNTGKPLENSCFTVKGTCDGVVAVMVSVEGRKY